LAGYTDDLKTFLRAHVDSSKSERHVRSNLRIERTCRLTSPHKRVELGPEQHLRKL